MINHSIKKIITFFIFLFFCINPGAQIIADSTLRNNDSLRHDSIVVNKNDLSEILKKNTYLNNSPASEALIIKEKKQDGKEFLFYLIGSVLFLIAIFKIFYSRYFNNIFRVFFNTSLRQNQLTDLLLQAKLPSMIFNIFFMIIAGIYAWLLLNYYHVLINQNKYVLIALCVLLVGATYTCKYLILKFIGWATDISPAINQYIFVIFLINKILCIILIPFVILIAFAPQNWLNTIIILSVAVIGIFFLLRYARTYGFLSNQLKIEKFHLLIYIVGVEILPIFILYKLFTVTFLKI